MNNTYVILAIAVSAAVTVLLRAIPFMLFGGSKKTPAWVTYLGKVLPCAIMGMLVVYCLKGINFENMEGYLAPLIASLSVVLTYVWKKNTLLSVICGTVCYMILVQLVF